jgi:ectoine hydroxylase-related dioxygenase (phytanoyl-CoA dioxygenase family)
MAASTAEVVLDLKALTVPAPEPSSADWNDEGVDAYKRCWEREHRCEGFDTDHDGVPIIHAVSPRGWRDCTPYMRHPEILDLVEPIASPLHNLLGEPAGMNLNLSGWVSTQRDWHQDSYLNEPEVGDYYAAVWVALGEIHPDSGPFQYVPGSHRWPQVTRELIGQHVDLEHPMWPKHSEEILSPLFERAIADSGAEVVSHLPSTGDVLIWHGRLLHRGSEPTVPNAYRPGFIAHFSGIDHRPAFPTAKLAVNGGWYFPIEESGYVF